VAVELEGSVRDFVAPFRGSGLAMGDSAHVIFLMTFPPSTFS
jgi:hypothetical protein